MSEYGIFNDEGLIEGQFYNLETAQVALAERYADDDASIREVCHDHPDEPAFGCNECETEDDE